MNGGQLGVDEHERRRRRWRSGARVWATNSSIDASRIGSGSTTTVAPASQMAWIAVTSARVVGPEQARRGRPGRRRAPGGRRPCRGPPRGAGRTGPRRCSPPTTKVSAWRRDARRRARVASSRVSTGLRPFPDPSGYSPATSRVGQTTMLTSFGRPGDDLLRAPRRPGRSATLADARASALGLGLVDAGRRPRAVAHLAVDLHDHRRRSTAASAGSATGHGCVVDVLAGVAALPQLGGDVRAPSAPAAAAACRRRTSVRALLVEQVGELHERRRPRCCTTSARTRR